MSENRSSGSGMGFGFVIAGLAFLIGPYFLPVPTGGRLIMNGFGVLLFVVGGVVLTITRLYQKTSADESFVRTGWGGNKCVIDGGALIIPVGHTVIPVSLRTTRLDCKREGTDALITGDNLRADVHAEFYIKVQKQQDDIIAAATSLGERSGNVDEVNKLVENKLISALRTVGATMPLNELHTKRNEFAAAVQEIVSKDLQHNGLTLESVTISKLDQTPPNTLKAEENVFDAQGARRIAQIVNEQRVARNLIQVEADKKVKEQDVEKDKFLFAQEIAQKSAAAEKELAIQKAEAEARQKSASFKAEQDRLSELADVEKSKAVQIAKVEQSRQVAVAGKGKEQSEAEAEVAKTKAVEIAQRDREIALAKKETERASAMAKQLEAERERETASQAVLTVQVTQAAEREKAKTVIEAAAEAEKQKVREQMTADVAAYRVVAEAKAEQEAAEKKADARLKTAEADKSAKVLQAEGDKALQLIPVTISREQVTVEQARVEVERTRLENQSKFERAAIDLQIRLAEIEATKVAKIEAARALGQALAAADIKIWGDPATFQRMLGSFTSGQANGAYMEGLASSMPEGVQSASEGLVTGLGGVLSQAVSALTAGKAPVSKEVESLVAHLGTATGVRPSAPDPALMAEAGKKPAAKPGASTTGGG